MVLMSTAIVEVEPGTAIVVNTPLLSRNALLGPPIFSYAPTIMPASLIPLSEMLELDGGASMVVYTPPLRKKP